EKLSSGFRINRAADDASGLVISQNLDKQISGLKVATQNAQDGISVVQTAEGALTQVNSMLQRIHDLIVQSANTASSDSTARTAAQNEIVQLRDEIDRIGNTTAFGNQNLLDGSFGAQAGQLTSTATNLTNGLVLTGATASVQFSLNIDAGNTAGSLVTTVSVNAGTYATAASFQSELQADIDAKTTGIAGFTGAVTVKVTDLGSGVWTVNIKRNSTDAGTGIAISGVGSDIAQGITASGAATVANTAGGVFQVGANVTDTNQIHVSIDDVRVTSGTNTTYTALANIDVTNTTQNAISAALVDAAIASVSALRGQLGADQNRFQSTIANLQVTTENLSASESRIRDTDMASEMVNFTRDQILLQAGTAMLAQANAAPQTILKLLQ
ncbi:MAG: flagellin domain protein, partial [Actinomycetia bacterium]|nr:flagellin domain protein [Actinomycetes bacterium]